MEGRFLEPEHLEDDELTYEFGIRSMPPVINEHRTEILRQRILMEMRGEAPHPERSSNTDLCAEVELCVQKLLQMEKALVTTAESNSKLEMAKLLSRFVHLTSRLDRIVSDDNRVTNQTKFLKQKLVTYVDLLGLAYDNKIVLKENLKGICSITDTSVAGATSEIGKSPNQSLGAIKKTNICDPKQYLPMPGDKNTEPISPITPIVFPKPTVEAPRVDGGEDLSFRLAQMGFSDDEVAAMDIPMDNQPVGPTQIQYGFPRPALGNLGLPRPMGNNPIIPRRADFFRHVTPYPNYADAFAGRSNRGVEGCVPCDREAYAQRPAVVRQPEYEPYAQRPIIRQPEYEPYVQRPIRQPEYEPLRPRASHYRNPIPSWHLVFSGDGKGLNINQFLTQIHLMARADRVTHDELLASAIHLFDGPARNWYIAFEGAFRTWEQLTTSLRSCFVSQDGDFMILKEVEQRHQGKEEPFILYLSNMLNLFKHLREQITEQKKVDLVMRNMSPYLADRIALIEIEDIQHLAFLCKKIEDVRNRSKSFRYATTDDVGAARRYAHEIEMNVSHPAIPDNHSTLMIARRPEPELVCWNCRETSHLFTDCKHPKMRVFCYVCGELGQLANQCRSCKDPKNMVARLGNPNNQQVRGGYQK